MKRPHLQRTAASVGNENADWRLVQLPHPRTRQPTRFALLREINGDSTAEMSARVRLFECQRVNQAIGNSPGNSCFIQRDIANDGDEKSKSAKRDDLCVRRGDFHLVTPFDARFLVLSVLSEVRNFPIAFIKCSLMANTIERQ